MKLDFNLDCPDFDNYLVDTYGDTINNKPGVHYIFRFPNSYGASVVKSYGTAGYEQNLWEVCPILYDEENKLAPDEYVIIKFPYDVTNQYRS